MNLSTKTVIILLSALAASQGWTHTLFAKPDVLEYTAGTLTVTLINGTYWIAESPVRRDRLASLDVRTPTGAEQRVPDDAWRTDQKLGLFDVASTETGTYVIGATTRPSSVRMTAEAFNHHLIAEGLVDQAAERRELGETDIGVSERYRKYAKALFQSEASSPEGFQQILGHLAEIVPLVDPNTLSPGDLFRAQLLFQGEPLADVRVFASNATNPTHMPDGGPVEPIEVRADANGIVEFEIPEDGAWYVRFIHLLRQGDSEYWYSDFLVWLGAQTASVPYESYWATLTFHVP